MWRMTGRGYTIFDTGIGRCGIAWGPSGIIGVQLPEVREIDTRRRLYQLYPDAQPCCAGRRAISPKSRWI